MNPNDLVQFFEEKMKENNQSRSGTAQHTLHYPMLIIYLGEDAKSAHKSIYNDLGVIWPYYKDKLCFLQVTMSEDGDHQYCWIEKQIEEKIENNDLMSKITNLFILDEDAPVGDYGSILLYYVLDTTNVKDGAQFNDYMNLMEQVNRQLEDKSVQYADLLMLLFNEDHSKRQVSAQIREQIRQNHMNRSMIIMSNQLDNKAILKPWSHYRYYQIIAKLIALSNNPETFHGNYMTKAFFRKNVMTIGYTIEKKPSKSIGKIAVKYLLELMDGINKENVSVINLENMKTRMGITKNGTLSLLDQYIDENLSELVPDEKEREFLPRIQETNNKIGDMTFEKADEYTFGTWSFLLAQKTKDIVEKITREVQSKWESQYKVILNDFTAEELIYLEQHIEDVKSWLCPNAIPRTDNAIQVAGAILKAELSGNETIKNILLNEMMEKGKEAKRFTTQLQELLDARTVIWEQDQDLSDFYRIKLQHSFFDHGEKMEEWKNKLSTVKDWGKLEEILKKMLNQILESDPIFYVAFEDELQARIDNKKSGGDAKILISNKLNEETINKYLCVTFALKKPVLSAILMRKKTSLYHILCEKFDNSTTYYYDTGDSTSAEKIVLYELEEANLF